MATVSTANAGLNLLLEEAYVGRRSGDAALTPAAPAIANRKAFPGQPEPAPTNPLLGSINLSLVLPPVTTPPTLPTEQFQTEISAYVSIGGKTFILSSGGGSTLQVTDATNPAALALVSRQPLDTYKSQAVATYGNLVAVALSPSDYATNGGRGLVRFYRLGSDGSLTVVKDVEVGYLPDSIAFNDQGTKLVIANEGEPITGYGVVAGKDPVGSIGIIDIKGRAGQERFSYTDLGFDGLTLPAGIRISGPTGTTQANDIEPEYVSILGHYAYVTLQENNGVAKVNLISNQIESIFALGTVDFKNQLVDLTDKDGTGGAPTFKPLLGQNYEGLRMADGIAAYSVKGKDYFITANEGDGREYGAYTDERRGTNPGTSSTPDATAYRVKRLSDDTNVGSTDRITTFGGRSISLFDADNGALLWDSGNTLQTIAFAAGMYADGRSDDKGVEPEGVVVAKLNGRTYAIVGMERTTNSMLAVFDVTDPAAVSFVTSTVIAGSISPEGLQVIEAKQSPTGRDQLIVSNEISNTLNVFDLEALIAAPTVAGAGTFASTMLKDVAGGPELKISSLITNGEFTNGLAPGSPVYAPTGIFDGMGAYDNGDGSFTLLVNSELGADRGYGYLLPGVEGGLTGARVSSLVIDKDVDDDASNGYQSQVLRGGLAYDRIHLDGSDAAIDQAADLGAAGFKRFCAANLVEANSFGAGIGFADRIYLVGEEEFSGDGGSFFALDVNSRAIHEVVGFGKGTWESATIIDTGSADTVSVLLFDDAKAPLYLWVGSKSSAADASFLERNGLAENQGTLYTYVTTALPENGVSAGPDSSDLLAFTQANGLNTAINGSWVDLASLDANYTQLGAPALRQLAVGAGALQLSRIEDGEVNPLNGQQAVFVSTGTADFAKGDLYGNVYTLGFDDAFGSDGLISGPGASVLKVVYDGDLLVDPTTGLRNPDNMTISADGHAYIQEDRANGGGTNTTLGNFGTQEASIWKLAIDPITGNATGEALRWAQIDRTAVPTAYGQTQPAYTNADSNGVGNWESSGIIDVSSIYDAAAGSYFLANVQAHSIKDGNIGGANYLVEGGQIDLIQQQPPLI
ncbi:choice-of-anchor I family protein [Cyanobium sp. ATX 6F1]|uniref:choice-of-anchor I family protein n=1 Tax=unclassified Cyanobium TaxID=2627006 RepID=UPI0020CEA5BE|nr:choice-of-anchor I family protein [Cyanobium sp. ATX 6F1]MCP9916285.1 choice-of-anchor I family protein [Cyanobium sp. ATX 6F1]